MKTVNSRQYAVISRVSISILLLSTIYYLLLPTTVHAQNFNLVNFPGCTGADCDFADLITLVRNLINALVIISTFLATAAFAYAGFLLVFSGGSEGQRDKAKTVFIKVLKGYLWILAAWVIVYTISRALLNTGFYFTP